MVSFNCFCQYTDITEESLLNAFASTITKSQDGKIDLDRNPWFTDNTNLSYFKNDTITFFNARSFKRDYCKIINWRFYDKNKFAIGDANYCDEPPSQRVTTAESWIELNLIVNKDKIIIELINQNKVIEKFKVLELSKVESIYNKGEFDLSLKLVRLNL